MLDFLRGSMVPQETSDALMQKGFGAWSTIAANDKWEDLQEDLAESGVLGLNRSLVKAMFKESQNKASEGAVRRPSAEQDPFQTPGHEGVPAEIDSLAPTFVARQKKHSKDPGLADKKLKNCWIKAYTKIATHLVGPEHNIQPLSKTENIPLLKCYFMDEEGINYLDFQKPTPGNKYSGAFRCTFPGCKWDSAGNNAERNNGWRNLSAPADMANVLKHAETGHFQSVDKPLVHWNARQRSLGLEAPMSPAVADYPGHPVELPLYLLTLGEVSDNEGSNRDSQEPETEDESPLTQQTPPSAADSTVGEEPLRRVRPRTLPPSDADSSVGNSDVPKCTTCHNAMHECGASLACPVCQTFVPRVPDVATYRTGK